jgi:hypothetical protein
MTLPLDCTPLRDAVVHALTQATAQPRSLALNPGLGRHLLFRELPPAAGAARLAAVADAPGVYVEVHGHAGDPAGQPMEGGDRRREAVTVEITCSYGSGHPDVLEETRAVGRIIERDKQRVIAALTSPGALSTDPTGADTGADDGCLRWDGYSSTGPKFPRAPTDERVVRVVHVFRTTVELRQPAQ